MASQTHFVNEHFAYADLTKPDRHALRDVLKTAFSIGRSSHELWSGFADTTAFLRRIEGGVTDVDVPQGVVGGAIVMGYPEEQYDYLAYIAVHPSHRYRRRLFSRAEQPHHGTELLHTIYDVMRSRVAPSRPQRYLMIEPAGDGPLRFYLRALPANQYPVKFYEPDRILSVGYDGLAL